MFLSHNYLIRNNSCSVFAMYVCRSCMYETVSAVSYMKHCRVHGHDNSIACGVPSCTRTFKKLSTFYSHISRQHGNFTTRNRHSCVQNVGLTVACTVPDCAKVLSFNDLVKHLKGHIACGIKIACPVVGCGRLMAVQSTFTSHMSVKHGRLTRMNVDPAILHREAPLNSPDLNDTLECENVAPCDTLTMADDHETESDGYGIDNDNILKELASFFLKLQCRFFVPVSTIQTIVDEFAKLHQLGLENISGILKNRLSAQGDISASQIDTLISEIKDDFFHTALNSDNGILTTHHRRCCYYKQYFRYVEPIEVQLGDNANGRKCCYHYIPIKETLNVLLKDRTVADCVSTHPMHPGLKPLQKQLYQLLETVIHSFNLCFIKMHLK